MFYGTFFEVVLVLVVGRQLHGDDDILAALANVHNVQVADEVDHGVVVSQEHVDCNHIVKAIPTSARLKYLWTQQRKPSAGLVLSLALRP